MPPFTLYVSSGDVQFWGTMFNIVAMICNQDVFIWGFAALAATFLLFKGQAAATVNAGSGNMGSILAHNAIGSILPFVVAMVLTSPAFQSNVTIESTTSGKVTVVSNVPAAISAAPSIASIFMRDLQSFVRTGFQIAGAGYTDISAMDNGFINPLKVLLTARSAVPRLGYIDSDVNAIVSSCLGPESGVDFGQINALVLNAGNGGAGTSQGATLAQTIPINGVLGTSLGALLYQASLQTSAFVADITDTSGAILSCPDAVTAVVGRLNTTLNSSDFARVVVGSVNGMDDPMAGGNFDITKLTTSYQAYRQANSVVAATGVGAAAAAAETINLLMVDVVNHNLSCLKASSSDKTQCYAAMIQSSETERTNLARVAEAIPALQYAGAFFNDLLALIVVLGPIIVMFMMFAGQDMGRCIKALAHILVWPMLSMGVGAEAINGMLAIHTSNFLTTIANGGYLSQSQALEVYKHFAMEIGASSSMMASLPSILSIIFALSGASALANHVPQPKVGEGVANNVSPRLSNEAPLVKKSGVGTAELGGGFAVTKLNGAADALSMTGKYGDQTKIAQRSQQEAIRREHSLSAGRADLATWQNAFKKHDYSALDNVDFATGERIRKSFEAATRKNESTRVSQGGTATRSNANGSEGSLNVGVAGEVGTASPGSGKKIGGGVKLSGGGNVRTSTSANDQLTATDGSSKSDELGDSEALTKAIEHEMHSGKTGSHGSRKESSLDKSLSTQKDFRDNLTQSESTSDNYLSSVTSSDGLVFSQAQMRNMEVAHQLNANDDFRMYDSVAGMGYEMSPGASKYMDQAAREVESGATDKVIGDARGAKAAQRLRAATLQALDVTAPKAERLAAAQYVTGAAAAMTHVRFQPEAVSALNVKLAAPRNETGVDSQDLVAKVDEATGIRKRKAAPPHSKSAARTAPHRPSSAPTRPNPLDSVKAEMTRREHQGIDGTRITDEYKRQQAHLKEAGLHEGGPGTASRTASNVVANFTGGDRTSLDKTPKEHRRVSGKIVDEK